MSNNARLFLVDPTSALPYGHTVPALMQFSEYLRYGFKEVFCFASHRLPEIDETHFIQRRFELLYNQQLKVVNSSIYRSDLRNHPAWNLGNFDPFEGISTYEMDRFIEDLHICAEDVIFFPGGDFYGVLGLLNAVMKLSVNRRPTIMIRLIGVFEVNSHVFPKPLEEFCIRINSALEIGLRIRISTETPRYAQYISQKLNCDVEVLPYPRTKQQEPIPQDEVFQVLCAGSARLDKGFNFLLDIAKSLYNSKMSRKIRITTQIMPYNGSDKWDLYTSQLYAMPNVRVLEPVLSTQEMDDLYRSSHVVLLPYAPDVYALRGSAVFQEAANIGRLAICLNGTAFASQIDFYGFGSVCQNIDDMTSAITEYASLPTSVLQRRVNMARKRFFRDTDSAYKEWFSHDINTNK